MSVHNHRRRLFFKQVAGSATDLFQSWIGPLQRDAVAQPGITSRISGDLASELLAMEAQRLGLDPDKDKEKIEQCLLAALERPGVEVEDDVKNK